MARRAVVVLGLLIFAIELHGQSASDAQRERDATAKAQAIAVSGGSDALAAEIAAELADLGRYEDRPLVGTYGFALKNFPREAVAAFKQVDFEIQLNLLTYSWERFAFPAMAPALIALHQSPPDDSARLRDMALRRLYQLSPTDARPLMLSELQRGDLRVSMTTLSQLPDAAFPDYEAAWLRPLAQGVLDERIDAAVRIERFGSAAILGDVRKIYDEQGSGWSCDVRVAVLAYIAKHDRATAATLIQEADQSCHEAIDKHPTLRRQQLAIEEEVIVTTTRTGGRIDDQPTRVEVLNREEVEEKMLMTPGDIVMMLNEMGGMRVQATSPSMGAATVRIQGMRGRYTRVLFDGLPLAGQQVGGLGLLQIPPMDLGQVEVIKGVASALYGAGAMGGVINLVARRPPDDPVREVLFNQSTVGTTDGVGFFSDWLSQHVGATLLVGGHHQTKNDIDDDGWYDLAGYTRGVVRPRVFWDDGRGKSGWATIGLTREERNGGVVQDDTLRLRRFGHPESIDTTRLDVGGSYQEIIRDSLVLTARVAGTLQLHDHVFGSTNESDRHTNVFAEAAIRGARGRHTWVGGVAFERESYDPIDVPEFAYFHRVPGVFVQDDVRWSDWLTVTGSARLDLHHTYGTFFSPRVAALVRYKGWTSRLSAGTGYFTSTPLTEETEAAGLSRLVMPRPLEAETGRSGSIDVTRVVGPLSMTATLFGSSVAHAIEVERESSYQIRNASRPATNVGVELLATMRKAPFAVTGTYALVRSRQQDGSLRVESPLSPRHSVGLVGMWEREDVGRVGVEYYFTGAQRLESNPYRSRSKAYSIVGMLAERKIGLVKVFLNAENLTNVRQTKFDPLVRPSQAVDGRWTVDAWAPLDGRTLNAGIRATF